MPLIPPRKQPQPPEVPEPEDPPVAATEAPVFKWRFAWAMELGLPPREASQVARSTVSRDDLKRMIARVGEPITAWRILR